MNLPSLTPHHQVPRPPPPKRTSHLSTQNVLTTATSLIQAIVISRLGTTGTLHWSLLPSCPHPPYMSIHSTVTHSNQSLRSMYVGSCHTLQKTPSTSYPTVGSIQNPYKNPWGLCGLASSHAGFLLAHTDPVCPRGLNTGCSPAGVLPSTLAPFPT